MVGYVGVFILLGRLYIQLSRLYSKAGGRRRNGGDGGSEEMREGVGGCCGWGIEGELEGGGASVDREEVLVGRHGV